MILEWLKAALFGIVEGITEWLPISSTGHMILLDEIVYLNVSQAFWEMFLVVIQLGAILAVVTLYFRKLNPFSRAKTPKQKRSTWQLWFKVIFACVPAGIIGLLLDDWMDEHFYNFTTVAITLILYGIAFIVVENRNRHRKFRIDSLEKLDYKTALGIGFFQCLSLIPGTSRSGSTILGASLMGTSREVAAEFSFFLAIPIMFGASFLKLVKYFVKKGFAFSLTEAGALLIGLLVAYVVSVLTISFLMKFIKKHNFKVFGLYRIILGIIVLLFAFFF